MRKFILCLLAFALFAGALFADAIHDAAKEGNLERVKFLISKGAKVNARDKKGFTPLHWAVGKGHTEIAELLISKGAKVNAGEIKRAKHLYTGQYIAVTHKNSRTAYQ